MAAFSSSSFSTDAFSVAAFDFSSAPPPSPVESRGGIDERKYREHLERLVEATRVKDVNAIREVAEEIDLDIETPELLAVLEKPVVKGKLKLRPINYNILQKEIDLIRNYLDTLLILENERDDEAAFLLMMQ